MRLTPSFDRDTIIHPSRQTKGWVQCPNCAEPVSAEVEDGPDHRDVLRRVRAAVASAWRDHHCHLTVVR